MIKMLHAAAYQACTCTPRVGTYFCNLSPNLSIIPRNLISGLIDQTSSPTPFLYSVQLIEMVHTVRRDLEKARLLPVPVVHVHPSNGDQVRE
jgi:hypothetical protein